MRHLLIAVFALLIANLQPLSANRVYLPATNYSPQASAGLAGGWISCSDLATLNLAGRGGWYYRWWDVPDCPPSTAEHVPMWGWPGQGWYYGAGYQGYALFCNEPDRPDQCNKTPAQLAALWVQFRVLCPYCRMIVLNVSRCDNTTYYSQWREAVRSLTGSYPVVTGYGCHSYDTRAGILAQVQAMRNWMVSTGEGDKQLWITEFARTWQWGGSQLSVADLQAVINQFEAWPWLSRYAAYPPRYCTTGVCPNALFVGSSTTNLTNQGVVYKNGASGYPGPEIQQ